MIISFKFRCVVNAAVTKQSKRMPVQPLKNVLIELWPMDPDLRDPLLPDGLYGLEVSVSSICSAYVLVTDPTA